MKELTLPAEIGSIEEVTNFVNDLLASYDCPVKVQMQLDIAIDELFSNIAQYAYRPGKGDATVRVEFSEEPISVTITFIDCGIPYDPLSKEDPDVSLSAEERAIGGLGIYMVKKSMDEVCYKYIDGKNIFSIKKKLFG